MVTRKIIISLAAAATLGMAVPAAMNVAQAFDMGNMMNPGEWFDDDDDRYYGGRYGGYGYGPYGYGGGPYGWGGGGPYGWGGGGPYGWGGGPYGGYGGGYGRPSTIVVNPASSGNKPAPKLPE